MNNALEDALFVAFIVVCLIVAVGVFVGVVDYGAEQRHRRALERHRAGLFQEECS